MRPCDLLNGPSMFSSAAMPLSCPTCQSEDVRRFSLVFKDGTSTIKLASSSVGVGFGGGGLGVGAAGTATTGGQSSLLAQELAPPKQKEFIAGGCLLALAFLFLAIGIAAKSLVWSILFLVLVAFGGRRFKQASDFNRDEYPKLMSIWERSFVCLRCGNRFEPALTENASPPTTGTVPGQDQLRREIPLLILGLLAAICLGLLLRNN